MTRPVPSRPVEFKRFPASFKAAAEGAAPGVFEALVSVFGNVDLGGDRMVPGAFVRTLKERGLPPIYWNHDWRLGPIGHTEAAEEREKGLWVRGALFVGDDVADPTVRRLHAGMKAGAIREFSFAYDVKGDRTVTEDGEEIRELVDVDLFEVGPVTVGMNPDTELLEVAGAGLVAPARKRAVAPHGSPVVEERWDGARALREAALPGDLAIFAWVDPEREDSKTAQKLPHHWPSAVRSGRPAVLAGVVAAMGALLGARGGVDIPGADRRGVYDHLARHYRAADREPPEFRSWGPEELASAGFGVEEWFASGVVLDFASARDRLVEEAMGRHPAGGKHGAAPGHLQQAHDYLVKAGCKCDPGNVRDDGGDDDGKGAGDPGDRIDPKTLRDLLMRTRWEEG